MNKEELISGIYMFDEDKNEWIDKQTYNCLYEEYTQLQAKINEAIEYMERYMFTQKENYDYIHLLDILKGVDKE